MLILALSLCWKNLFSICHCNSGLAFKSKKNYIELQNFMYLIRENSQNLCQKHKWASWLRHLAQKKWFYLQCIQRKPRSNWYKFIIWIDFPNFQERATTRTSHASIYWIYVQYQLETRFVVIGQKIVVFDC
jgi:hypothetical protein